MKIYHYDQFTGELLGPGKADPNPRNPDKPIVPAFATELEPLPEKDGHRIVYKDGVWHYTEILKEPGPEPPTEEELAARTKQGAINAIQGILDAKARELGFDSIHTAAAWVTSKNPARKARAEALLAWGDAVWDFAEEEWEKQSEGKGTFTTVDEFLGALPKFPGVIG